MQIRFLYLRILVLFLLIIAQFSCKKYLDQKPNASLLNPSSVSDYQTLMDNYMAMNSQHPGLSEIVSGDVYATSADYFSSYTADTRAQYTWEKNADVSDAWRVDYVPVAYANIVLDGLALLTPSTTEVKAFNDVKGQALFFRSFQFWQIAQLYCKPYSPSASSDLGIALRVTSDVNVASERSTVQQTYDRILADLHATITLLPDNSITPMRPGKTAAYAMLARVYLSMNDFSKAGRYADSALQLKNSLLDFNTLTAGLAKPVPGLHTEVIFYAVGSRFELSPGIAKTDSLLYRSYDNNDLRKTIFYLTNSDNTTSFKGSYGIDNGNQVFYGLATDELYLIRAESTARAGNRDSALADLNRLLVNRWKNTVIYQPVTATDAADALSKILIERRKELVYRGLRWSDLRRRNLEGANLTLSRTVNNTVYTLPPNDLRWVLLIPSEIVNVTRLAQNPR